METLVTLNGGQVVVSSERIADGVGKEHKPVIQLVRQNQKDLEEFGQVRFEIGVGAALPQGGRTMGHIFLFWGLDIPLRIP